MYMCNIHWKNVFLPDAASILQNRACPHLSSHLYIDFSRLYTVVISRFPVREVFIIIQASLWVDYHYHYMLCMVCLFHSLELLPYFQWIF